jgi:hypothetical protein
MKLIKKRIKLNKKEDLIEKRRRKASLFMMFSKTFS